MFRFTICSLIQSQALSLLKNHESPLIVVNYISGFELEGANPADPFVGQAWLDRGPGLDNVAPGASAEEGAMRNGGPGGSVAQTMHRTYVTFFVSI